MNELKEHALLFGETKNFVDEENYEQTDGGSYAPYYYLGSSRWGGWKVNKRKYFDLSNEQHKSKLFEAVGKGKFVNSSFLKNRAEEKPTNSEIVNGDGVTLVDYSEKAFAIIGDTNSISVLLKQLGGRFNRNLKCGAGWIFPKTKLDLVKTNITNLQFEAL